jgi:ABC-2 type transport system ATP-binding protein
MSSRDINQRSDELLELVGLKGRDRESVRRFSKGMYQRLGLAQALMHDPDLLVLDEPTDGLDPVGRTEVRKVIERLRDSGKTIFLNSHILQEVEVVCTRVAILANGEICGTGTIDELSRRGQAEQVVFEVVVPSGINGQSVDLATLFDSQNASDLAVKQVHSQELTYRITVKMPEQQQVDQAVDRLRKAGVSIVRLEVKRPTLEDTFMRLVGSEEAES